MFEDLFDDLVPDKNSKKSADPKDGFDDPFNIEPTLECGEDCEDCFDTGCGTEPEEKWHTGQQPDVWRTRP